MFWSVLAAIALLSGLWMAWPLLRARSVDMSSADGAISIYRDQLDEVENDRDAGLISEEEADAARAEIERRALHAARTLDAGISVSHRAPLTAGAIALLTVGAALGAYVWLGTPEGRDMPLADRQQETLQRMAESGDINSRIQILIEKTRENPQSFEDWWMLARSYGQTGDHALAADAYRQAVELSGDRPAVLSAYAEAMTLANGNKVPGAARLIFEQLAADVGDPRARYYLALAKAQSQDFQGAANDWAALAASSAPNAPWAALVRRDIVNMARFLKQDVTLYLPDASPEEITAAGGVGLLPGQTEPEAVDTAAIEAALEADPKDYKAWIELARARTVGGDTEGALEAMKAARGHFAGAPFVLQKFAEAERALGLDLAAGAHADDGPRGPTAADMAAAAELTPHEQEEMIDGMVAGLAARLEENPGDPDGWVMLVRSYATLGLDEKARAALGEAELVFAEQPEIMAAIREQTRELVPGQ